jgi:hypothetical protein
MPERLMELILIMVLVLLFGGGGGYWNRRRDFGRHLLFRALRHFAFSGTLG